MWQRCCYIVWYIERFSKGSSLLNILYQITTELTFENFSSSIFYYKNEKKATYSLADEPRGIIDLSAVSVVKALGCRWKLKSEKSAQCQIYHTHYKIYHTKYAKKQRAPSLMSHEA